MSGLHFDTLEDCPPGLRKVLEMQQAKKRSLLPPPVLETISLVSGNMKMIGE